MLVKEPKPITKIGGARKLIFMAFAHFFVVFQFCGVCIGIRAVVFNMLSESIALDLRHDFYVSIINKDVSFFDAHRTGDLSKWQKFYSNLTSALSM